jgi:hypothetical protein
MIKKKSLITLTPGHLHRAVDHSETGQAKVESREAEVGEGGCAEGKDQVAGEDQDHRAG